MARDQATYNGTSNISYFSYVTRIETMSEEDFQNYSFLCESLLFNFRFCEVLPRSLDRFNFSQSMENTKFNKSYILEVLPKRTTTVKTLNLNQKARTRDSGVFFSC